VINREGGEESDMFIPVPILPIWHETPLTLPTLAGKLNNLTAFILYPPVCEQVEAAGNAACDRQMHF